MSNGFLASGWKSLPPVTRSLLVINIGIWLACALSANFTQVMYGTLGLHYWGSDTFNPIQLVSYMFLHDAPGLGHIFFNMFALYMFGRMLEMVWGSRRFILFYFVCGVGAALVQEAVWSLTVTREYIQDIAALNHASYQETADFVKSQLAGNVEEWVNNFALFKNHLLTVGASGAIFGLLLGFGFVFPNVPMYLFFIPVPIKAKYLVAGYAALELVFGATGALSSVAHYAHLGGMLFGLILLIIWMKNGTLRGRFNNF